MNKKTILLTLALLMLAIYVAPILAAPTVDRLWTVTSNLGVGEWWSDYAVDVAVDSTGVYVVGADSTYLDFSNPLYQWRIEKRSLTDGSVIWSQNYSSGSGNDHVNGIAVDDTAVYVVGDYDTTINLNRLNWRIEKRDKSTGSIVWYKTRDHPPPVSGVDNERATSVAVGSTGIYVVGYKRTDSSDDYIWLIEKLDLNGVSQWNKTRNPSASDDRPESVAVDSTGVYVVGYTRATLNGWDGWLIEKLSPSGDSQWNRTRQKTDGYWMEATGVAATGSAIYVVGIDYFSVDWGGVPQFDHRWLIEKLSPDGVSIWNTTSNPSPMEDDPEDVAADSSSIYVVGIDKQLDPSQWRLEKRNATDGSSIFNYTVNPSVPSAGSLGEDIVSGVAVDDSAIYLVGDDNSPGLYDWQWRIEKLKKWATLDSVATSTGSGNADFNCTKGDLVDLAAVAEGALPSAGKPNFSFPHGFFSFNITGLNPGDTVTINITLPSNVPVGTQYWKYGPTPGNPTNHWYPIPIGDDDGDNVITITITDGGDPNPGDDDLTANGVIVDQGGPGQPAQPGPTKPVGGEIYPVDKVALLTPYIASTLVIAAATVVIIKKRRQ